MKKCQANLVFIVRLDFADVIEKKKKDVSKFQKIPSIYDSIIQSKLLKALDEIKRMPWKFATLRPSDRTKFNLLTSICSKYGQIETYHGMSKRSIITYSRQNKVMAAITRNTEYLVHDGDFEYWCLADVHFCELKIAHYNRRKLYEAFGFSNHQQMQLLLAVSKITSYEKKNPLLDRVEYVKQQQFGINGYDVSILTGDLSEDERNKISNEMTYLKNFNDYNGNWNDDIYYDLVLDLTKTDEQFK